MNQTTPSPLAPAGINPFVRGSEKLRIERQLLITYENDCPPCFRPLHESQAHLPDHEVQLFPCIFNDDFALVSEAQIIPTDLDERCQSTGLVRQVVYAVMGETLNGWHHLGDLYSQEEAQALVRHLSFETGHYSRAWEISTGHLSEEAVRYLAVWIDRQPLRQTGLLFELFALPDCCGFGCKLIGTPWTDEHLRHIGNHSYSELRQEQLAIGVPESLADTLYLAALADVRFLIFDPSAMTLEGLPLYDT